jgi:hypothetical protein
MSTTQKEDKDNTVALSKEEQQESSDSSEAATDFLSTKSFKQQMNESRHSVDRLDNPVASMFNEDASTSSFDEEINNLFKFIEERDDTMANPENSEKHIYERFKNVDQKIEHKEEVLTLKIDNLTEKIDKNLEDNRQIFGTLSNRMDSVDQRIDNLRYWIAGTAIALFVAITGVVYFQSSFFQTSLDRSIESSNERIQQFIEENRRADDRRWEMIKDLKQSIEKQDPPPLNE